MQLNTRTKIYLAVLAIVLILCVTVSIWSVFFRGSKTTQVTQKRLTLNGFNNYIYTSDYTLATDKLDVGESKDNFILRPNEDKFRENIRISALKLGLSNEATNEVKDITTWTSQGVNDLNSDFIVYNGKNMTLNVSYAAGLNSSALDSKDVYKSMINFFGLPEHEVTITENQKFDIYNTMIYQAKIFNRPVYFNKADLNFSIVGLKNGKVITYFTYVLPAEDSFNKDFELIPLKSFDKNTFINLYAQVDFKPENATGASAFGSEFIFSPPAEVGIRKFEPAYIYYNDFSEKRMLIPIFHISGVFSDAAKHRGEAVLLVVNQTQN